MLYRSDGGCERCGNNLFPDADGRSCVPLYCEHPQVVNFCQLCPSGWLTYPQNRNVCFCANGQFCSLQSWFIHPFIHQINKYSSITICPCTKKSTIERALELHLLAGPSCFSGSRRLLCSIDSGSAQRNAFSSRAGEFGSGCWRESGICPTVDYFCQADP